MDGVLNIIGILLVILELKFCGFVYVHNLSVETFSYKKKVIQYHYRPEVSRGFQEVKVTRLRDNGPGWW